MQHEWKEAPCCGIAACMQRIATFRVIAATALCNPKANDAYFKVYEKISQVTETSIARSKAVLDVFTTSRGSWSPCPPLCALPLHSFSDTRTSTTEKVMPVLYCHLIMRNWLMYLSKSLIESCDSGPFKLKSISGLWWNEWLFSQVIRMREGQP
jgi:hypothetical protein